MRACRSIALFFVLLLPSIPSLAADHCVRAGATGDGSNWSNAFPNLPADLVRGDTYYIAAGSYPAYRFDDPESGSLTISIKRATPSDHGTDSGWQPAYGLGQAVFGSVLHFARGRYLFDGAARNEGDWFDGAAYGFRIAHNGSDQNIVIQASNVTIRYTFIDAIVGNLPSITVRRYAVDTDTYGGPINTGLVFHRMFVNGSNNVWFLRTTSGALVEYSASSGATGNAANHGEIVNLYFSGNDAVIRYNIFKSAYVAGGGTALVAITQAHGLQFYGNIAYDFSVGDGALGFIGGNASNCRIYNNTFVNGGVYASGFASDGSNNLVYNNLWVQNASVSIQGTHDYNAFSDSNPRGEAHAEIGVPTSIFTNYAARNLTLSRPTSAGTALAVPYNVDMFGNLRGADGVWDRGAIEFTGGSSDTMPPASPQNLRRP